MLVVVGSRVRVKFQVLRVGVCEACTVCNAHSSCACNYVDGHDDDIIQTSCHEKCKYMILSSSFTNPKTFALENLNFPAFRLQVGLSLELDVVAFANE